MNARQWSLRVPSSLFFKALPPKAMLLFVAFPISILPLNSLNRPFAWRCHFITKIRMLLVASIVRLIFSRSFYSQEIRQIWISKHFDLGCKITPSYKWSIPHHWLVILYMIYDTKRKATLKFKFPLNAVKLCIWTNQKKCSRGARRYDKRSDCITTFTHK